jgi:hypothetical protein
MLNDFGIRLEQNLNAVNLNNGCKIAGAFCYFDKEKTYEHCTKEEVLKLIQATQQLAGKKGYGAYICQLAMVAVHYKNSHKAYSSRGYTVTLSSCEESFDFWLKNYENKYGSINDE